MSSYAITSDTSADLPETYLEQHDIRVVPLYYLIKNVTYGKENDLSGKEFYALMRSGELPTTNAVNPEDVKTMMRGLLEQGLDVLHIAFSSGLSGSCQSAFVAAEDLKKEFPERKIAVIDSLCASLGQGLLIHKAVQLKDAGNSLEEAVEKVKELIPHLCHQFTVDDLNHLHRGGRVSKATAVLGTMLNVKPVLHVNDEGKLEPLSNIRGRRRSLNVLVENMCKSIKGYEEQNDIFFISHGDCEEEANYVAEQVKAQTGIQDCLIHFVGPVIGAHSGPGTVALFFIGNKR